MQNWKRWRCPSLPRGRPKIRKTTKQVKDMWSNKNSFHWKPYTQLGPRAPIAGPQCKLTMAGTKWDIFSKSQRCQAQVSHLWHLPSAWPPHGQLVPTAKIKRNGAHQLQKLSLDSGFFGNTHRVHLREQHSRELPEARTNKGVALMVYLLLTTVYYYYFVLLSTTFHYLLLITTTYYYLLLLFTTIYYYLPLLSTHYIVQHFPHNKSLQCLRVGWTWAANGFVFYNEVRIEKWPITLYCTGPWMVGVVSQRPAQFR